MTLLVVALDQASASRCARAGGLKGKWLAVTPDSYQVLDGLAVPPEQITWDFAGLPWGSGSLPNDMLDALQGCISRGRA